MLVRLIKATRSNDGQSLVLAALAMLVLTVGVLTTVNIGHSVHERIRLQNNADAGAYSIATTEARLFNYVAFTNRAIVSNYVMMTALASIISYLALMETQFAAVYIMAMNAGCALILTIKGAPAGKKIQSMANSLIEPIRKMFRQLVDQLKGPVGKLIEALQKNAAAHGMQQKLNAVVTAGQVGMGIFRNIIQKQDPKLKLTGFPQIATTVFNMTELLGAVDFRSKSRREHKQELVELINASRKSENNFITKRNSIVQPSLFGGLSALAKFLSFTFPTDGQTKVLANQNPRNTRNTGNPDSYMATGDSMVANDRVPLFHVAFGNTQDAVNVQYSQTAPKICRFQSYRSIICFRYGRWRCESDNAFKWPGMVDYTALKPKGDSSFRQPEVFVALNKDPKDLEQVFTLKFKYDGGAAGQADIDFNTGRKGMLGTGLLKGLNAWTRGQVYYHRPGAWQEPPNMFNPHWRGRLAPIGQLLQTPPSSGGGSVMPVIRNFLSDNLITH
ncbi:MAG: hypothetical protein GMKNLPBB_00182 [Myxococcota bacterium]|nr:hypothetical protein [Myxococcota bacterium]